MNNSMKPLEGLSSEDRRKILAETETKYKSVIDDLQDLIEFVDDQFNQSLNYKGRDNIEFLIKSLSSIIRIQTKLLTDVRLVLNKIYNEHTVELHYIHLNLEILNENINVINEEIMKLKK